MTVRRRLSIPPIHPQPNNPLLLAESVYGLNSYIERRFQLNRISNGQPIYESEITVLCEDIKKVIDLFPGLISYKFPRSGAIISEELLILIEESDRTVEISVSGDTYRVNGAIKTIEQSFPPVPVRVKWVYKSTGDSVRLPIRTDNMPRREFYPSLGKETLASYYDRFMASSANVLVLIGPPGTGKTSFIRGLLHHTGSNAMVSYDPKILEDDEIFADFMSGKETFMILEDADTFLASRTKIGNTVMHRFLNLGDGLISTKGKKIIFSTNLPSVRDVDSALIRPGRCFDVMHFNKLDVDQAKLIRPEYSGKEAVSLAELLTGSSTATYVNRQVGF